MSFRTACIINTLILEVLKKIHCSLCVLGHIGMSGTLHLMEEDFRVREIYLYLPL